jgi:ABC-type multidrug transport system ATPase subunit
MVVDKIAIKTSNLTRHFGNRVAVNNLNIEIRQGEIFSLLGRNGAGKTTTIKLLCCLLNPTSGNASIMDFNIIDDPLKIKEIIGVSPQETAIAVHLNTKENLLLMGGVSGKIGYALPFAHAVDASKALLSGSSFSDISGNLYVILIYTVILFILAILSFRWTMRKG